MPETMTVQFHSQAAKLVADDVGLLLTTITHPDLHEVIRTASSDEDVVSRGQTFVGWPVNVTLPSQGTGPKRGQISFLESKGEVHQVIRTLKGKCGITFEVVSRDAPDDVFYDHGGLKLENVEMVDLAISGEVVGYGADAEPWPFQRNTPARTPALYV